MIDVAPELLEKIKASFETKYSQSNTIKNLLKKVEDGKGTYAEANEYAIEVGQLLARAFQDNLSSSVLPEGKMYYNIAKRIIDPTMTNNYELVATVAQRVQQSLNKQANIGIKAIKPKLNDDKIKGIINKVSSDDYDKVSWVLDEPIQTFTQSVVDDAIKANAEFHYESGMKPKIIRYVAGDCCEWCQQVAGRYTYPDVPKDVYRRHQRCRCTVNYYPGEGKVQNVHTKQWKNVEKIEKRKLISVDSIAKSDKIYTGARILDPNSKYAKKWAASYYEEIRHKSTDCKKIAERLGYDVNTIKEIKKYLFEDKSLWDEHFGIWRRFDEDAAIAQSWQRLAEGKEILKHDLTMIEHELYEMDIKKKNPNISHREAHSIATEKYDYQKEVKEYYGDLRKRYKKE